MHVPRVNGIGVQSGYYIHVLMVCPVWKSIYVSESILHLQSLISRNYRGDVDMSVIDKFLPMVLDAEEEGTISPILVHEKVTFVYIKHNNLYCILEIVTTAS